VSAAGRTRRGPTVTSYHVQLSDGQEFTVIADAEVCGPRGFACGYGSEGWRFGSRRARLARALSAESTRAAGL
jgi:hypothetical protein